MKKSKNISKSLSIIYGLQTCLDFDKAFEIASNLFQLYEYCKQEILKGFTKKIEELLIPTSSFHHPEPVRRDFVRISATTSI